MKTKEEIRATTGRIPRPENYKYGEKLKEWDASLPAGAEDVLSRLNPIHDRIIVRLIEETPKGTIVLTDARPLIGGMRKALVLKCGPGKWMTDDNEPWRRPMTVKTGQTVYIGNWTDLEAGGLALCQEGDVRTIC
jgi:co-chaperonin GroES (HSP10)